MLSNNSAELQTFEFIFAQLVRQSIELCLKLAMKQNIFKDFRPVFKEPEMNHFDKSLITPQQYDQFKPSTFRYLS